MEEIAAIRRRVAEQYPPASNEHTSSIPLVDLLPLFHARDAAEGKVAAIGKVNPRPPGFVNGLIQTTKRQIARALGWFVRDQVDFNYASVRAHTETMEALNTFNRSLVAASKRIEEVLRSQQELERELRTESDARLRRATDDLSSQIRGVRLETRSALESSLDALRESILKRHQEDLDRTWDAQKEAIAGLRAKLQQVEAQFQHVDQLEESIKVRAAEREREDIRLLRAIADIQHAFMQRIAVLEGELRQAVDRGNSQIENRVQAAALAAVAEGRQSLERKVHEELTLLRQRVGAILASQDSAQSANGAARTAALAIAPPPDDFDSFRFSERFRGSADSVRSKLQVHVDRFLGQSPVLDLGCGRGEFLALLAESGTDAIGVESNSELVLQARAQGLNVEAADLFDFLEAREPGSAGGIFSAHVIEHMAPAQLARLVNLAWRVLRPGGVLLFETPNPACLAIFATYFYLDPTHVRPVPAELVTYLLEEAGFTGIEIHGMHAAEEEFESLKPLPEGFRQQFFGFMDYAVVARKP